VAGLSDAVAGGHLDALIDGTYLFGAPMQGARFQADVSRSKDTPRFDNYPDFVFGDQRYSYYGESEETDTGFFTGTSGRLAANGKYSMRIPLSAMAFRETIDLPEKQSLSLEYPYTLNVEAAVKDVDDKSVSARRSVTVHAGKFVTGIKAKERYANTGENMQFEIIALSNAGENAGATEVKVSVLRQTWKSVRTQGPDGTLQTKNNPVRTLVATENLTASDKPVAYNFKPDKPGEYYLIVQPQGEKSFARLGFYVSGESEGFYMRNDDQVGMFEGKRQNRFVEIGQRTGADFRIREIHALFGFDTRLGRGNAGDAQQGSMYEFPLHNRLYNAVVEQHAVAFRQVANDAFHRTTDHLFIFQAVFRALDEIKTFVQFDLQTAFVPSFAKQYSPDFGSRQVHINLAGLSGRLRRLPDVIHHSLPCFLVVVCAVDARDGHAGLYQRLDCQKVVGHVRIEGDHQMRAFRQVAVAEEGCRLPADHLSSVWVIATRQFVVFNGNPQAFQHHLYLPHGMTFRTGKRRQSGIVQLVLHFPQIFAAQREIVDQVGSAKSLEGMHLLNGRCPTGLVFLHFLVNTLQFVLQIGGLLLHGKTVLQRTS
ncbi:MAG TPA: hypothetical protein PKL15_09295, partial [Saprospiraceae bacterium]|nr:hypothetical protein [Saprospiraceae bacterium]